MNRFFTHTTICILASLCLYACKPEDNDEILVKTPTVSTNVITDIDIPNSICGGVVINDGGSSIIEQGICWSAQNSTPTIEDSKTTESTQNSSFSSTLSNLQKNLVYYVRAYARNKGKIGYGNVQVFKAIPKGTFAATTLNVTNIYAYNATVRGMVTNNGASPVITQGLCWSTEAEPTVFSSKSSVSNDSTTFTSTIENLSENTKYFVRAFAINKNDTVYGEIKTFTTSVSLIVTTNSITNISSVAANCNVNIVNNGSPILEQGVCFSTSQTPTVNDNKIASVSTNLSFDIGITNLTENTTYYCRAFAKNKNGITYGDIKSFSTPRSIVFNSLDLSNITTTNTTANISFVNNGSSITTQGICWSTNILPTISDNKLNDLSGLTNFSLSITNLQQGTTYYARAFVTNQFGTTYSDVKSFTTLTETTLTLQPGAEGKDGHIDSYNPNTNYANATDFDGIAWTNSGSTVRIRGLIDFDLSSIPSGTTIKSAKLSLYNNPLSVNNSGKHSEASVYPTTGGDNAAYLSRITSTWDESTVTWNNQPTTTTTNQVSLPASTDPHQDYIDIDVTALIQDILNNKQSSYGIMLQLQNENYYRALIFASGDNTNAAKHPKLEIRY